MRYDSSLSSRIICTVVASLVTASIFSVKVDAQAIPPLQRPQLVVGIMVEGLNDDYLRLLNHLFVNDGFRRLMREGVNFETIDYGPGVDKTSAAAILFTGAAPTVNGIPGNHIYDPEKRALQSPFLTVDNQLTPKALLVSTLADEVRLDGGGKGLIYSLAADPEDALIMAGHAGNSGFWIDELNGLWTTSNFYNDFPQAVKGRNNSGSIVEKIDTMEWAPILPPGQYPDVTIERKNKPFRHRFADNDAYVYKAFKKSAKGNTEITDLAIDYLRQLPLGKRGVTDMLNLSYSVAPYEYGKEDDPRFEMFDSYIRLDKDLERLFKMIDTQIGKDNVLVFLVGTPAPATGKRPDERWNIPSGQFSGRKASSLLNMYLMALHGNGEWVSSHHNRHFYLNHTLIKEHNLDAAAIRQEAANFLIRMSGVSGVYTVEDVMTSRAGSNPEGLKRNMLVRHSGDVIVEINPGWELVEDDVPGFSVPPSRDNANVSSAYIFAPGVTPERVSSIIDARTIAPTIARLLRIRSPNGASLPPIRL